LKEGSEKIVGKKDIRENKKEENSKEINSN